MNDIYMYIYIYTHTVATSGVNRLASQIYHNRLFRKKLQQNLLHMCSAARTNVVLQIVMSTITVV
jgi:hypothetical protein